FQATRRLTQRAGQKVFAVHERSFGRRGFSDCPESPTDGKQPRGTLDPGLGRGLEPQLCGSVAPTLPARYPALS
ncbi:MAG: hypothetical protein KAZ88_07470, partial [Acidimicrobiia bacterium]|nr:hypothetical protein [Acidimicrobiia bacterium]